MKALVLVAEVEETSRQKCIFASKAEVKLEEEDGKPRNRALRRRRECKENVMRERSLRPSVSSSQVQVKLALREEERRKGDRFRVKMRSLPGYLRSSWLSGGRVEVRVGESPAAAITNFLVASCHSAVTRNQQPLRPHRHMWQSPTLTLPQPRHPRAVCGSCLSWLVPSSQTCETVVSTQATMLTNCASSE